MKQHSRWAWQAIVALTAVATLAGASAQAAMGDRITVSGTQFMAGGQRIWMNGANTPWNNWNDFGGNFNPDWWNTHFQQLHAAGVNSTRVWITCSGEVGINISEAGVVSGATALHWSHLDQLMQIAEANQIYIMATLISFDHFKNTYTTFQRWRNWINSDANIDSYINNYLIPFVTRYGNDPWMWSIDLVNEPEWIFENQEVGNIPLARHQAFYARAAKAIHENSPILVTIGNAMPKYQSSTCGGCLGDYVGDAALRAVINDPDVYLDFRQNHYYSWQDGIWGIPHYVTPGSFGFVTTKPWVLGEVPANGSTGHTITQDFEAAFQNGWQGIMPWTSNGVDSNGSLAQMGPAASTFRDNHPTLVFPGGATATPTNRPTATPTNRPTATPTSTPTNRPTATPTQTATPTTRPTATPTNRPTATPTTPVGTVFQAESASLGGGTTVESNHAGFMGTGFVNFPASGGFAQFTVAGGTGGARTLRFRFALGASGSRTGQLQLNGGTAQNITFSSTGAWATWSTLDVAATLVSGNNTVRLQSTGQDLANVDQLEVLGGTSTPTPTATPTTRPTATPTTRPTATPTSSTPTPTSATPTPTSSGTACANPTTVSMPITIDGVGDLCLFTTGTINVINNWNNQLVTINGGTFTNIWSNQMPPRVDGGYYIRYISTVPWSHFEAR